MCEVFGRDAVICVPHNFMRKHFVRHCTEVMMMALADTVGV